MSLISLLKRKYKTLCFTTPSHGQKFFIFHKFRQFYKYDISETDTHKPHEALLKAQQRAAKIYGVKYTKFLTNGSTSGIIAAVLACTKPGDKVLIWDNAHPSHLNAVKLAGCEPVFYKVEEIEEWGIYASLRANTVSEAISQYEIASSATPPRNDVTAVIVTSPTYEGIVSDIRSIKKACGKAYLIVDEAHGALYPFSDKLPESAIKIADFTVHSLHKTAGGLNPTALLHSNCEIDPQAALDMINTTSPSYPLLASIEANINFLNSQRGGKYIEEIIETLKQVQGDIRVNDDPLKILVKVPSEKLFAAGIEDEKSNEKSTLLLCGIGTNPKKLERLKKVLKKM